MDCNRHGHTRLLQGGASRSRCTTALPVLFVREAVRNVSDQYRRGPPRPPPPPPDLSRSCASFTLSARPSISAPFRACIARAASEFDISTNAKPRGRPVSRSVISETFSTVPCAEKSERTASSVAEKGRFPTYNLVTELLTEKGKGRKRKLIPASEGPQALRGGRHGSRKRNTALAAKRVIRKITISTGHITAIRAIRFDFRTGT